MKGLIKIDGNLLPGDFEYLRVGQEIIIDEIEIQDKDGNLKQPAGYDEGIIEIQIRLISEDGDVYKQLSSIQKLFRARDGQIKPDIHIISNAHANARGIKKVLFRSLQTEESKEDDSLIVTIELEEYLPLEAQIENAVIQNTQKEMVESVLPSAYQDVSSEITKDTETP